MPFPFYCLALRMNSILVHLFCPCLPVLCRYGCYPFDHLSVIVEHTCPMAEVRRPYSNCWGRQHNSLPCSFLFTLSHLQIFSVFLKLSSFPSFRMLSIAKEEIYVAVWHDGVIFISLSELHSWNTFPILNLLYCEKFLSIILC